ncbi:TetR family transcriptional regulator [Saccharopolyspora erythraea]|uniref:TetR/AcrR family transcriptional regulator n=1 Tax=Saccharopolyspora erythraea TaxID=1836 RepID=UPI001BA7EFEC|nr:TetR/AcrR family transcriptional regulator [Saccharopolyspora erythraea]QUH04975.1 TetR family transcriptional regulator [Saccharopolyspora erythraea]
MVQNPARRTALIDAAIEVLARDGARGLTFRAVDEEAGVPKGTASNYFANRDDLLTQAGRHVHHRMGPDPAELAETMKAPPTRELDFELLRDTMRRLEDDRTGYLALLELRLEATRRPELRAALTETIRSNLAENIRFHLDSGLPGDRWTVVLLYFALTGLAVEKLTVPDVLADFDHDELVDTVIDRILPAGQDE